jgi:hypothetical protein
LPSRSLRGCGVLKTLAEPAGDQRLEGDVEHSKRCLSNFLFGPARMRSLKSLKPLRSIGRCQGQRHCSIDHENSHVKSWPRPELVLASDHPARVENQGRDRASIGAPLDRDLPVKIADDRLDKL